MDKWMRGMRGTILMILLWIVGWGLGFGGIMELVDPDGKIQDVWPTLLAVPGLIGGVIFSAGLAIVDRGRGLNEIPLPAFAAAGGVTGFLLGLLSIPAEVGDVSPGGVGMIGIGIMLGLVAGLGTGVFFRLVAWWQSRSVPA